MKNFLKDKYKIKKIFLLRIDGLGDVLLSIPAIKNIRQNFPDSHIKLLIDKGFSEIVELKENVDEIIGFDREKAVSPLAFMKFLQILRKEKYDLAIDLMTRADNLSSLIVFFLKSRYKCGYAVGLRKKFLNFKIIPDYKIKYETECVFDILRQLGLKINENENFRLKFSKVDENYVFGWLDKKGIKSSDFIVGIHPGVGKLTHGKAWQIEKFVELAKKLKEKYKAKITITGSASELNLIEKINKVSNNDFHISIGQFNLSQLIALISKFKLFIVGNTGPMHISLINKIPTVIISGFSNMTRWGVNSSLYKVVCKNYDCIPCEGKYKDCKTGDFRCIKDITVEEVYKSACSLLESL